jgi:hypothetical protein
MTPLPYHTHLQGTTQCRFRVGGTVCLRRGVSYGGRNGWPRNALHGALVPCHGGDFVPVCSYNRKRFSLDMREYLAY